MCHCTSWIQQSLSFKSRARIVREAVKRLRPLSDQFTHVALSGYSGSIIGSIVAQKMKKDVVIVRKDVDHEVRASSYGFEHDSTIDGYVFIDDFISTGSTLKRVTGALGPDKLIAIYTYYFKLTTHRITDKNDIGKFLKGYMPIVLTPVDKECR